jgi:hypothetical protein
MKCPQYKNTKGQYKDNVAGEDESATMDVRQDASCPAVTDNQSVLVYWIHLSVPVER